MITNIDTNMFFNPVTDVAVKKHIIKLQVLTHHSHLFIWLEKIIMSGILH